MSKFALTIIRLPRPVVIPELFLWRRTGFAQTLVCAILLLAFGCDGPARPATNLSLPEARQGFTTKLIRKVAAHEPVPVSPPELFSIVHYESPAGKLAAYLSADPEDGRKHPAIIWLFGGFSNGIGETAWEVATPENDQSASAFRNAGIIMMYPSLRGGNDNPGFVEGFLGEVDDVLAAAEFLGQQEFIDADRIYLGGHSTGGTLAVLVAASTGRFRAIFSLGPVDDVVGYGDANLPIDCSDRKELELRSPANWLHSIRRPVFVFEGTEPPCNLNAMKSLSHSNNPKVRFHAVNMGNFHCSVPAWS